MSLSEVYLLEFNLMFPSQESFTRVKDILAVCLASLKPLTPQQVYMYITALKEFNSSENSNSSKNSRATTTSSTGHSTSWEEFLTQFELLSLWLLPERADKTIMFFHSTVKDW